MDRSLGMTTFGADYLDGASAKTARRTVRAEGIPYFIANRKMYVKQSDADRWRESKMITPQTPSIKDRLAEITAEVIARKKGVAA